VTIFKDNQGNAGHGLLTPEVVGHHRAGTRSDDDVVMPERPEWHDSARCVDSGVDMFPGTPQGIAEAVALCQSCPVRGACHDAAEARGEIFGVWGGRLRDCGARQCRDCGAWWIARSRDSRTARFSKCQVASARSVVQGTGRNNNRNRNKGRAA
jgi:hypothetical protein